MLNNCWIHIDGVRPMLDVIVRSRLLLKAESQSRMSNVGCRMKYCNVLLLRVPGLRVTLF